MLLGSRFTDHLGTFMIHCPMLQHEDHGVMATFEVVEAGQGDLPAGTSSLQAALARDVADPAVRSGTQACIESARDGQPAPLEVLARCAVGAAPLQAHAAHEAVAAAAVPLR